MRELVRRPERRRAWRIAGCALLAVLMAESLLGTLSIDAHYVADEALAGRSVLFRTMIYLIRCFSVEPGMGACVSLGAFVLLYFLPRLRTTGLERGLAACFGVLFTFMQMIGWSYDTYGSWDALFGSRFILLRAAIIFAGRVLLSSCLVLYAFRLADRLAAAPAGGAFRFSWKRFALAAGLVALCWLPYYILFFPGLGNPDTSMQIAWFLHYPTEWLQYSAVRGPEVYATNHHPYFTTVLYGAFAKLGLLLDGNIFYGVALYCLCQMLVMALVLTGVWFYLRRLGLSGRICRAGLAFTALFPLCPLYAITMLKDTLFGLVCLTFSVLLFEVARTRGERLKHNWFCGALLANGLLVALTKNQGVYFVAAAAAFCLIFCRRRLRAAVSLVLPVVLFQVVWLQVLLPAWNVAPGGRQEVLGPLFQQTARYVVMYPEDVTAEEADAIRAVIDYDHLAELYNPTLADDVKFTYNQDATEEELSAYYQAWLQMLRRHPDAYLQALLNNVYGSFYLGNQTALSYTDFDNREVADYPELVVEKTPLLERVQPIAQILLAAVQRVPGIGVLFCVGGYPWVVLFLFLDVLRRRQYAQLLAQLPAILSVAVLLVSPVSGSYRYAMPMIFLLPFLIGLRLLPGPSAPAAAGEAAGEGGGSPKN